MFARAGLLDEVDAELDRLNDDDLSSRSAAEIEVALHQLRAISAKTAALEASLSRRFEVDRTWATTGALTPAAYLGTTHRVPSKACSRQFTMGRKLAELPAIKVALAAGRIDVAHRDKIVGLDNPRVHDRLVADQVVIVRWAMALPWSEFTRMLQQWLAEHDPDGADPALDGRGVDLDLTLGGTWVLHGSLDLVGGEIAKRELVRLERQLFDEDWAEAKARLGCEPITGDLRRTARQRRADALVLAMTRSAALPDDGRRGRFLFIVRGGEESFARTMETSSGLLLQPSYLAPYLDDRAVVQSMIYDGPFTPLKASRQRSFRDLLEQAVKATYPGCVDPWCDEPIDNTVTDHVVPHSKGGETSVGNGAPRCDRHNAAKGDADPVELAPVPRWFPPADADGVDGFERWVASQAPRCTHVDGCADVVDDP